MHDRLYENFYIATLLISLKQWKKSGICFKNAYGEKKSNLLKIQMLQVHIGIVSIMWHFFLWHFKCAPTTYV